MDGVDKQPSATTRQRARLGRSIIQSQLVTSGVVLLVSWILVIVQPASMQNPLFFGGIALVFAVTGAALLVPWSQKNKRWAILLPLLDIVALGSLRASEPQLGTGILLVFPVIWLARNFAYAGAVGGVLLSTAVIWITRTLNPTDLEIGDFPSLVLIPITLAFVATTSYVSGQRTASQRVLLTQQAAIIEDAFARARRQENLLHEVLNAVEFGVISFDSTGTVTLINDAQRLSLASFNAPRNAIVHPVAFQTDRITPYPQDSRPFARAIRGQAFDNLTFWVGEPGSRQVAYSVTSRRLETPDGLDDGGVLVMRDVTAELEAISARDSLIGSVSHELRTPLTSILGYLELAMDDPDLDEETRHMIEVSYRNAERLVALVTDLLLAASQASSTLPVALESCDISELIEQAIDGQLPAASERGISIDVSLVPHLTAQADPLRMRQVVDNLLSNAIKYNREGGKIKVRMRRRDREVAISISDTGLGIAPADLAQLFDRFFRTESAKSSKTVGTGLGLGITRDIIRQHGGDLSVTSELGTGSTFTITFPTEVPAELSAPGSA